MIHLDQTRPSIGGLQSGFECLDQIQQEILDPSISGFKSVQVVMILKSFNELLQARTISISTLYTTISKQETFTNFLIGCNFVHEKRNKLIWFYIL